MKALFSANTFRALSVAAALAGAGVMPAQAQDKIVIGSVGAGSATEWPVYIAIKQGFAAQAKIAIDFVNAPSSAAVMQQIAAGSINMGTTGLVDALRAADKGAPTRILRVGVGPSPYEVYASPSVKSWADLRGKTVMIGGIKDITRIYFEDMARPNGLSSKDFDYIFAGATAARFAALASGSVQATIITPPFNFKAAGAGYTKLGTSADFTKSFPFTGYPVNIDWARANKEPIKRFLAAYATAVDWFYAPANRDAAIAILIERLKSDLKDVADTYDFFVKLKMFDREGSVEKSGVDNLLAILAKQGDIEGGTDLARFYDASLVK